MVAVSHPLPSSAPAADAPPPAPGLRPTTPQARATLSETRSPPLRRRPHPRLIPVGSRAALATRLPAVLLSASIQPPVTPVRLGFLSPPHPLQERVDSVQAGEAYLAGRSADTVIEMPDGPEIFETSCPWEDFIDARPRPAAPDRDRPRIALPRPRDHDARGLRDSERSASGRRDRRAPPGVEGIPREPFGRLPPDWWRGAADHFGRRGRASERA